MPVTIVPADPKTPDECKIHALNLRTTHGDQPGPNGTTLPNGQISVSTTLGMYSAGEWTGHNLAPISVSDVEQWIADLVTASDSLAGAAATKFAEANDCLKWLAALRGSQLGICARPTV